jgi:cbb3-type cytochrome oxidase subunit 3
MIDDDVSKTEILIYTIFSIFIIVLTLIFVALGCGIF